jgi:hypothetical protein
MQIKIRHHQTNNTLYMTHVEDDDQHPIRTALERAVVAGVNLSGADLSKADLINMNLSGANLSDANLYAADLRGTDLIGTDLRGTSFYGADLRGVDFTNANLTDADFGVRYEDVPVVLKLDARILELLESGQGKLDMGNWHTCETTHCRAGWAVVLAGDVGHKLEAKIGTAAAGALIYHRSTGRIPDFFTSNKDALADIIACAHDQGGIR